MSFFDFFFGRKKVVKVNTTGPSVAIVDHCGLTPEELKVCVDGLNEQISTQFSLPPPVGYGIGCAVRLASVANPPKPDEWVMGLFLNADQPGALGYHDRTPEGLSLMKIFPLLDKADGVDWRTTASHELCETLADPELSLAAQDNSGTFWAYESCDAVENDTYNASNGCPLSNFVTPLYFQPPTNLNGARLDFMGLLKYPGEIRPGGYGQRFDPKTGWVEVGPSNPKNAKELTSHLTRNGKTMTNKHRRASRRQEKFLKKAY